MFGCPPLQAKVFELVNADGQPTGKVLKIAHTGGWDSHDF